MIASVAGRNPLPIVMLAALGLGLLLSGCPGDGEDSGSVVCDGHLETIRVEILVPNCTGSDCHDADDPAADLDLTQPLEEIETQLVGIASTECLDKVRVAPGDREGSFLWEKLHTDPACGEPMPIDGQLSSEELDCIGRWIDEVQFECETCGGSLCVNLLADNAHCGMCGMVCENATCTHGACVCDDGFDLCDDGGQDICVDLGSDAAFCGDCSVACPDGYSCDDGQCVAPCGDPWLECGDDCIDPESDLDHCGDCDQPCDVGQSCVAGECV